MPFLDLFGWLGLDVDKWLLVQSADDLHRHPSRCHAFEKEWIDCAHGIGQTRAKKECRLEWEDFYECMERNKTFQRLKAIRAQRDKLIKEGKYTPPPHHMGKGSTSP
ncbi:NADH dehydrogenase [ubiquinone] iron-sulfur protein 5 [Nematolebias whitei]|uniref:NADH dehydrogenase [ubiquinone] iron-sulfur protein 5 n=1 Tax=Nematolebias whitei TaxID=451745 RepID=UPI001896D8C5|nr:NADH dehydrogenase [ubiquinone] iron-sulfur protein 5 [Nematolebias whitei]